MSNRRMKFADWFVQVSSRVAEISATHGGFYESASVHMLPNGIAHVHIPAYGPNGYEADEKVSADSEEWELQSVLSLLERFNVHLNQKKQIKLNVSNAMKAMSLEHLEALHQYFLYFSARTPEPLGARERYFCEMILAEKVRRSS